MARPLMADTRRGHRDDSIYFDHRVGAACLDARLHKACAGSWRGVVPHGLRLTGKRIRRKVRGQSKPMGRRSLWLCMTSCASGCTRQRRTR